MYGLNDHREECSFFKPENHLRKKNAYRAIPDKYGLPITDISNSFFTGYSANNTVETYRMKTYNFMSTNTE